MINEPEQRETEVLEIGALEAISRAEIDTAIATARRFPRQLSTVKKNMLSFATLDQETAESCFYSLPRGGKNIQGPSVRLAEIAVSCYGNLRAGSRILQTVTTGENPHVVVQAVAMDLENNIQVSIEKRRRIIGKKSKGGQIDEDDINLAANSGSAIAFRDAVFKVVPLALIKPVFEQAKRVAIGDASTLVDRRSKCIAHFAKMGVPQDRVLAKLSRKSIEDVTLEDVETLLGLHNAIKDGEVSVDEAFPAPVKAPDFGGAPMMPPQQPQTMAATTQPSPTPASSPAAPQMRRGRPPKAQEQPKPSLEATAATPQPQPEPEPPPLAPEPPEMPAGEEDPFAPPNEPITEPEAQPEPVNEAPKSKNADIDTIRQKLFQHGVSEEQLFKFLNVKKVARGEVKLEDFVTNQRSSQLANLAKGFDALVAAIKQA